MGNNSQFFSFQNCSADHKSLNADVVDKNINALPWLMGGLLEGCKGYKFVYIRLNLNYSYWNIEDPSFLCFVWYC